MNLIVWGEHVYFNYLYSLKTIIYLRRTPPKPLGTGRVYCFLFQDKLLYLGVTIGGLQTTHEAQNQAHTKCLMILITKNTMKGIQEREKYILHITLKRTSIFHGKQMRFT